MPSSQEGGFSELTLMGGVCRRGVRCRLPASSFPLFLSYSRPGKVPGCSVLSPPLQKPSWCHFLASCLCPLNLSPTTRPKEHPGSDHTNPSGEAGAGLPWAAPAHLSTFLRNRYNLICAVRLPRQDAAYWEGSWTLRWSDIWSLVGLLC